MLACHDAVRLGGAPQVADRLEELVALCQGALVRVAARQARAVTERDGAQLAAISRVFEQAGMLLHAAEAAAQAAASTPDTATGRAQAARAVALARRCDGARTPALATLAAPALTRRELQIARLAGSGRTSREIAARLVVSVRTVDNHLASVFAELGVSRRTDLAPLPDPAAAARLLIPARWRRWNRPTTPSSRRRGSAPAWTSAGRTPGDADGIAPRGQHHQGVADRALAGRIRRHVDHRAVHDHRGRAAAVEVQRVAQSE